MAQSKKKVIIHYIKMLYKGMPAFNCGLPGGTEQSSLSPGTLALNLAHLGEWRSVIRVRVYEREGADT